MLLARNHWTTSCGLWSIRPVNDPLLPFMERHGAAVLDGGLASELEARGFTLHDRLWSARALVDAPELIAAIHRDYLEAGADVITTATYQATLPGFVARGLTEADARRVLLSGVTLAADVRDASWPRLAGAGRLRPLVAASLGSYGAFLADGSEYAGDYRMSVEALANWHRPRLRLLQESGADLLAFETIPSLPEAEAIVRLLDETEGPPAWISFQARDAARIADGNPVAAAAAVADRSSRIVAIGVNCIPPERVEPLLRALATGTDKPLCAYPNRGDAWDATNRRWISRGLPVDLGAATPRWLAAGARLIGGCCRTTPDDIRAIRAQLP
jgi:homocysteine S-methyltransferase